jgi:hypothetical protein
LNGEPTGPAKLLRADKVLTGNTLPKIKDNYLQKDRFVLKAAELKMIAKTLDVLHQTQASVRGYLTGQNQPPHLQKQYEKIERAITRMISIIETDNDLSREKI